MLFANGRYLSYSLLAIAKQRFNNIRNLLTNTKLSIQTRIRFVKCYIWPILLYGCETWSINKDLENRLRATEMWLWRRTLKISWTERKTNEEVLQTISLDRELINSIRKRQLNFMGHIIREDKIEFTCLSGKIEGRRQRGRPRQKYIDRLLEITGGTQANLIRSARDRKGWRSIVANVQVDTAPR